MNYFEYIETGGICEKEIVPERFIDKTIYNLKKFIRNTKDEYLAAMICVPVFVTCYTFLFGIEVVMSFLGFLIAFPVLLGFIFILNFIQPKFKEPKYRAEVYKKSI